MDKLVINILLFANIFVGAYSIFISDFAYGVFYVLLILISIVVLSYSYCAKCPSCQKKCAHPQIGYLRKLLPARMNNAYNLWDYSGLFFYLSVVQILPQYWLWQNKVLFAIYWVLSIVVFISIVIRLCSKCENKYCKLNRNSKFQSEPSLI